MVPVMDIFLKRRGFITDIKFGGEKVKNQFSYNFEGLSKSASPTRVP